MALSPLFILYVVIAFSFVVTSVFMFRPKDDERIHIIFFWLACALSLLVTFINATALPATSEFTDKIILAWCGLIFTALGVIIRMVKGKTNTVANIFVMVATVYGCVGYFLFT